MLFWLSLLGEKCWCQRKNVAPFILVNEIAGFGAAWDIGACGVFGIYGIVPNRRIKWMLCGDAL